MGDGPTITFGPSTAETMLEVFDMYVDDETGVIVDGDGEPVESYNGHEITVDELAGIVDDGNGGAVPLSDNFADLVEYVGSEEM